jgi:hypothetical protein
MEDIRRLGYSGTASTDTTTTEAEGSITDFPAYTRVTVVDVDNPAPRIKKVTVTVSWRSGKHSVALETMLVE